MVFCGLFFVNFGDRLLGRQLTIEMGGILVLVSARTLNKDCYFSFFPVQLPLFSYLVAVSKKKKKKEGKKILISAAAISSRKKKKKYQIGRGHFFREKKKKRRRGAMGKSSRERVLMMTNFFAMMIG